jgi:hypothetical protein
MRVLYISLFVIFTACNKVESTPTVYFKVTLSNNIILDSVEVLAKTSNSVRLKVSSIYLTADYVFSDYRQGLNFYDTLELINQIVDENYQFDSSNVSYSSIEMPYSVAVVLDKNMTSGWGEQGYSDGFNYFVMEALKAGNECLLVGAGRADAANPSEFYTPSFTSQMDVNTKDALYRFCSSPINGSASIYDAIDKTIDKMAAEASHNNKHIVTFWDAEDDQKGIAASDLIAKAKSNNIKLSFFRWDHSGNYVYEVTEIAERTGGYSGVSSSTAQIQTLIFSLHKILAKNYVNLNFYLNLNSPFVGVSSDWRGYFNVDYSHVLPFYFTL